MVALQNWVKKSSPVAPRRAGISRAKNFDMNLWPLTPRPIAVPGSGTRTMPIDAATMSTNALLIASASGPQAMPRNEVAARSRVSALIAG